MIDDLSDVRSAVHVDADQEPDTLNDAADLPPWFAPAKSPSIFRALDWNFNGNMGKSLSQLQKLADTVITAPDFNHGDWFGVNFKKEAARVDKQAQELSGGLAEDVDGGAKTSTAIDDPLGVASHSGTGWTHTSVPIPVPDGKRRKSWDDVVKFAVKDLALRQIVPIIREAFADSKASTYHFMPFRHFWQPVEGGPPMRVLDELYTTDGYIQAHQEVNALPRHGPLDTHERVVVALMLYSDSTRLAQFGSASLWPMYLFFGNQSKYARERPSEHACHHLAYLPKVCVRVLCYKRV